MADMRIRRIACGHFVNRSERLAAEYLDARLKGDNTTGEWLLLTNVSLSSGKEHLLPAEIDILAVGSKGVQVIEVKHWDRGFIVSQNHAAQVEHEASKANDKAKIVAGRLKKAGYQIGFIAAKFLLTKVEKEKFKKVDDRLKLNGVEVYGLNEWRELLELNGREILASNDIEAACKALVPSAGVCLTSKLHSFGAFTDLESIGPQDSFRREFRARRRSSRDRVILHLYDLSAIEHKDAQDIAEREFKVVQRLQKSPYMPSLLDSFQEAPAYPGELFFFSYLDPEAATLEDRSKDQGWSVQERIHAAKHCVEAMAYFHEAEEKPILHRYLTPRTIRIRSNNKPIFTQMQFARIEDSPTLTGAIAPEFVSIKEYVAPEVLSAGLGACTKESDIFGLCASLSLLFKSVAEDSWARRALSILEGGQAQNPSARTSLDALATELAEELTTESEPEPVQVEFWDEDTVKDLNGRSYRILSKLGSGSVGSTFKVMEVHPETHEELSGPYVAKAVTNESVGQRAADAYARIRGQTGGSYLAGVLEVANTWRQNEITALLRWIEGDPLIEWKGVLSLYLEELGEESPEDLLLQWIQNLCTGLAQLHAVGLVHGDVSPKNIIVNGANIALTDYDLSTATGSVPIGGTSNYCAPCVDQRSCISCSDDIFALAATFFEIIYDKPPFLYPHGLDKGSGLNWEELDRNRFPRVAVFLDKATALDPSLCYENAATAFAALQSFLSGETDTKVSIEQHPEAGSDELPAPSEVGWLRQVQQAYPASPKGNAETRGLDSPFAKQTYVETALDTSLAKEIRDGKVNLVILCGNAGDGKTAFLQNLSENLGLGAKPSAERLWDVTLGGRIKVRANLDGAAAYQGRSAQEILDEFFAPFHTGNWPPNLVHLIAINDGPLLAWLDEKEESWLTNQLYAALQEENGIEVNKRIRFIDLNARSLVGGCRPGTENISTDFLDCLLEKIIGEEIVWKPCLSCTDQGRCSAWRSIRLLRDQALGPLIRDRLTRALQAVHQRGQVHITARGLRAALSYIFFGFHDCEDYHANPGLSVRHYWDRAFDPGSEYRQGELLAELAQLDPALDCHPKVDAFLIRGGAFTDGQMNDTPLASLRRRAYFEWPDETIRDVGGSEGAIDLTRGKHLSSFRTAGTGEDEDRERICSDLCDGIARLEDLPEKAFMPGWVPLRITPRTPTESFFWVNKPRDRFSLRPGSTRAYEWLDALPTHLVLTYTFENGHKEELIMGAELFHLLMELKDGYQLTDARSDDVFANLSIFKQRLAQEEERSLFSWNPMDERVFRIRVTQSDEMQDLAIEEVKGDGSE